MATCINPPCTISSWVVTPTHVFIDLVSRGGITTAVHVKPPSVTDWVMEARVKLYGGLGCMVGLSVRVEIELGTGVYVALHSPDLRNRVMIPATPAASGPTTEQVESARRYINSKRTGVQAPLDFSPVSWCSARVPVQPWSDEDIIAEAVRLGPKTRSPTPRSERRSSAAARPSRRAGRGSEGSTTSSTGRTSTFWSAVS